MPQAAHWMIATDVNAEATEATITECIKEIRRLQEELVPEEELSLVKSYFNGELLRELDGVFSQSDALKHKLNYGQDNTFYLRAIDKVRSCTPKTLAVWHKILDRGRYVYRDSWEKLKPPLSTP